MQNEFSPSNREIKRLNSVNEGKVLSIIGEVFNFLVIFLFYFYLKKKKGLQRTLNCQGFWQIIMDYGRIHGENEG